MPANGDAPPVRHAAHYGPFSAPSFLRRPRLPVDAGTVLPAKETFVVDGGSRLRCLIQRLSGMGPT